MICYKGMTFCDATDCRHFETCHRALTEKVKEGAEKIGLEIAVFSDPKQNECYESRDSYEKKD